tara:strand:+ start:5679 stop:6395 length:717 start_codon:yes stop_codon:yes gene_type:complete
MKKLLLILLLVCLPVSSATHYSWNEWIKETVFDDKEITGDSQFIHIEAPYRAINGGNVPIKIYTDSPGIVKFTLIIDENPTPCCAIFEFDNIPAYVETNIRVNAYTYLRVVAEDIYGNLYMNTEFIKAAGGCSAPSMFVSDKPLGSIELVKKNGEYNKYQFWHPNYSGLQFNQLTRTEIPAEYIDKVEIHFDDASFRYEGTIGIAENVYFSLATNKEGDVTATDNLGNHFSYLRQPRD